MNAEKINRIRENRVIFHKKSTCSNITDCRSSFLRQRQIIDNISQFGVAQKYADKKSDNFNTVMFLSIARKNLQKFSPSYLSKNVASSMTYYGIDDNDDSDIDGLSRNCMHAEIAVYLQELKKDKTPRSMAIATERKPCSVHGGCEEFFKEEEVKNPGFNFYMEYLVNDDKYATAKLYSIYRELNPPIDSNEALEKAPKSASEEATKGE